MLRVSLLAITLTLTVPSTVLACGGFFCNNSMPVDQAGENIVFAVEENGTITVHVQILYQGPSESFAWILPAPSVPELGVGTEALFQTIDRATAPQFVYDRRTDGECATEPECMYPEYDDLRFAGEPANQDPNSPPAQPGTPEVMVHLEERVGPYDAVVVSSEDANALVDWLQTNGYDIPDSSRPIIADYAAMNMKFVALKLQKDKMAGDITPLTMNFEGEFAMIPIRLTAIAATPDMPITAWVLGANRVKAMNFAAIDFDYNRPELWTENAYDRLAGEAIDAVGGHGFITEYAGPNPSLDLGIVEISDLASASGPTEFMLALQERGLNRDPGLLPVLLRVLTPPEGEDPQSFYNCIARGCDTYDAYLADRPFDAARAAEEIDSALMAPRRDAKDMLDRHPQLTRLYTRMSPSEMTADPAFHYAEGVAEASNVHTATRVRTCDSRFYERQAPLSLELPNGDSIHLRDGMIYTPYEYCERNGGTVISVGTRPPVGQGVPAYPMVPPSSVGGGGCEASASSWGFGAALSVLGLLLFLRRRKTQ